MSDFLLKGQPLALRHDGTLLRLSDWSLEVAEELARRDGLTLTDDHWDVLTVMREYYQEYNISPIRKLLVKEVREKLDANKFQLSYLNELFPNGLLTQSTRLAGIPIPMLDVEVEPVSRIQAVPIDKNHFINNFEFDGLDIKVYPNGHLVDTSQWNESVARFMAEQEGIELSTEHLEVITFLRAFYVEYGIVPMVKLLRKHMRQQLGESKSSATYLYDLFPGGPARQGSRIGGLPSPQGCIDG